MRRKERRAAMREAVEARRERRKEAWAHFLAGRKVEGEEIEVYCDPWGGSCESWIEFEIASEPVGDACQVRAVSRGYGREIYINEDEAAKGLLRWREEDGENYLPKEWTRGEKKIKRKGDSVYDQDTEGEEYFEEELEEGRDISSMGLEKLEKFARRHGVRLREEGAAQESSWIELMDIGGYESEEAVKVMLEEFEEATVVKIKMEGGRALVQFSSQEEAKAKAKDLRAFWRVRLVPVE